MLDFLYQSGWGAFTAMLLFQIPFLIVFVSLIFWKSVAGREPSGTDDKKTWWVEAMWLTAVVALFLVVNIVSIQYLPAVSTARAVQSAVQSGQDIQDVDVTAASWYYEMSNREFIAGDPIRFSAKATDTQHGFAVYHPDGRVLFTMMLIPGVGPASLVYTFQDPGTYKVRCLEYCGLAHHDMSDELIVTASAN